MIKKRYSRRNAQLRILTYGVIAYMLLAFTWWTVLLFQKNEDAFRAKAEYLQLIMAAQDREMSKQTFWESPAFLDLQQKYRRQEWMIMGEAIVFVISLVIGVWLINRSYNRAIVAEGQRRNFLLSITHELKSPLASIRLTLETFLKRNLSKAQQDTLSVNALKETERLNDLVTDLLFAAKVEQAYQPVPETVDIVTLTDEIVYQLEQKYPQSQFEVKNYTSNPKIEADTSGIYMVVLNLLENAVKYSFDQPVVSVRLSEAPQKVILEVADQGIGISDKDKKQVFERFYRVGNEETRQTKGTGLGLYIVREIVRAHGGTIVIKNNQPKGSIFEVMLPRKAIFEQKTIKN